MSAAVIPFPVRSPAPESYAWLSDESERKMRRVVALMRDASQPDDGVDVQAEILAALQRIEQHLARL